MDVTLNEDQRAIEDGVAKICARFGDDDWTECDTTPRFPHEFYNAMAEAGFLGITMPEELGGLIRINQGEAGVGEVGGIRGDQVMDKARCSACWRGRRRRQRRD